MQVPSNFAHTAKPELGEKLYKLSFRFNPFYRIILVNLIDIYFYVILCNSMNKICLN